MHKPNGNAHYLKTAYSPKSFNGFKGNPLFCVPLFRLRRNSPLVALANAKGISPLASGDKGYAPLDCLSQAKGAAFEKGGRKLYLMGLCVSAKSDKTLLNGFVRILSFKTVRHRRTRPRQDRPLRLRHSLRPCFQRCCRRQASSSFRPSPDGI